MQGTNVKITGPNGRSWQVPLSGMQLKIGRTADNDVVLDDTNVSSHHCVIGRDPTGAFMIHDLRSTNGTWLGEQRVQGSVPLQPGVQVLIGGHTVMIEPLVAKQVTGGFATRPVAVAGPLIRKSEAEHRDRRFHDRVKRYAEEWDKGGRPGRLMLRGRNLARALEVLESGADPDLSFSELEETFIRASAEGRERNKVLRIAGIAGGAVACIALVAVLATRDWGGDEVATTDDGTSTGAVEDIGGPEVERVQAIKRDDTIKTSEKASIEHTVIPAETVEEIALRYGVAIQDVMRWNGIDESTPLEPGRKLTIRANKTPLPQQMIVYRPDQRESWSSLAKRFDVPVAKLQAYNPAVADAQIKPGSELTIYVDPKPLRRKADVQIPEFTVRPDAISIGAPQDGKIENAIQFPPNDALYKRRNPQIMWCAGHMAKYLQQAIASFRYTYEFEGEIVVADMSHRHGGPFPPHGSHQAGRDVDIWLPSLKGVYQPSHIREGKERRPYADEADWFALYGFLKALHETGEVHAVFLAYDLHEKVYDAAKLMGASDEELDQMIAYPRGAHYRGSLLQHSAGHDRHIHVRFKCGPNDQCSKTASDDPGD